MTPRLVATDLDGTLVGADGLVSGYTRSVLQELDHRGVPVIFVTGRPLRWAMEVFEHVGSLGLAIISNGALVWDVAADVPRLSRPLQPADAVTIAELIRDVVPGSAFAVEMQSGYAREADFLPRGNPPADSPVAPVQDLVVEPVLKLLARHEELAPLDYWERAESAVGARATITWSSTTTLLEISAPGVTKASTLELVCHDLGFASADVIAFGDMPNDVPMLTWAGMSYAMKDAHPSVVSCAVNLAPSHDEDGVARVLAEVFAL